MRVIYTHQSFESRDFVYITDFFDTRQALEKMKG